MPDIEDMGAPNIKNSNNDSNQSSSSNLLATILFSLAGVFLLIFLFNGEDATKSVYNDKVKEVKQDKNAQELVNKHLSFTSKKFQLDQQKINLENSKTAKELYETKATKPFQENHEFTVEQARNNSQDVTLQAMPSDPNQLIQTKLLEDQKGAEYSEAYKKEYARQFVENARRGGWDIKLSDDYRVISVRPIRQNNSMKLFESEE